jgi:hypothetical protein
MKIAFIIFLATASALMVSCKEGRNLNADDVVIENDQIRLIISGDATAKSLIFKPGNEECLVKGISIPVSTITGNRPYQHNLLLTYSTQKTTFNANSVRREGDKLIIRYDLITWETVIKMDIKPDYIRFSLESLKDLKTGKDITEPLIEEMWFLQLPVKDRNHFGEWLNVIWDDKVAVNILGTDPFARIDSEKGSGFHILKAGIEAEVKLKGPGAALITCSTDKLLDNIATIEEEYGLPHGVKARRHNLYNASYYWSPNVTPLNIDKHIKYAKMGGFRTFMIYYPSFIEEGRGYSLIGNYDFRKEYPNGMADLKAMVDKITEAGMVPGFHFLHTHIGISSRYVTPIPDPRLNLRRIFTLARPVGKTDTIIYVEQNPQDAMMADNRRILKLGTELISYKNYTTTPPYMFTGCERGFYKTTVNEQPAGYLFGLLDVSEFGATSIYINENSSIQDEIAGKLAEFYKLGFKFVYYDGSEGLNPPFWFHIANAQFLVHKKLQPEPIFAEGSAKTHFSWHILSRANAFDTYPPEKQKEETRINAAAEAPRMKNNFSSLNFGWLDYVLPGEKTVGTQPDMLEFVTSRAAAWDCPISIKAYADRFDRHPRTDDNLEVLRRWEEVRANHWLSEDQKKMLQNLDQEHTLLVNEKGDYELVPYDQINDVAGGSREIRAFVFERNNDFYVVYWHISGNKRLYLPVNARYVELQEKLGRNIEIQAEGNASILPAGGKRYVKTGKLTRQEIINAFREAKVID